MDDSDRIWLSLGAGCAVIIAVLALIATFTGVSISEIGGAVEAIETIRAALATPEVQGGN